MPRQKRIINRLIEASQYVIAHPEAEVILSMSRDNDDAVSTWVESTPTTMLTVGVSMAVKSAVDQGLPLFVLQELIHEMYERVRDGKECKENDTNGEE